MDDATHTMQDTIPPRKGTLLSLFAITAIALQLGAPGGAARAQTGQQRLVVFEFLHSHN